jgi:hypothetical protein
VATAGIGLAVSGGFAHAVGPPAANVAGITDDTDLFFTMMRALGLKDPTALP